MRVAFSNPATPTTRRVVLERIDTLDYIPYEYELQEVATRLKRHGYRGAICGPAGCGKSVMLQALGDELMTHGLTPLPLLIEDDRVKALPTDWRRTIRKARHTDALLLDGYDLLPAWARVWVGFASRRAGAVIVTAQREVRYKTLAKPKPNKHLLNRLARQILPASSPDTDYGVFFDKCKGNLRDALRMACDESTKLNPAPETGQKQAG